MLAFVTLFLILDCLAQILMHLKRYFVLLQLDIPCFVDLHGRRSLFFNRMEERTGDAEGQWGEGLGGEEGG